MTITRYSKPLLALKEDATIKGLLSAVAFLLTSTTSLFHIIEQMFSTPVELVLLLIIAMVIDFVTGIKSAKDNKEYIMFMGLRQTWVKILEYSAGLIILTGIANVFGTANIGGWVGAVLKQLRNIHWLGYFYAIFTEFKSVAENMKGKKGRLSDIINMIEDKINKE